MKIKQTNSGKERNLKEKRNRENSIKIETGLDNVRQMHSVTGLAEYIRKPNEKQWKKGNCIESNFLARLER